MSYADCFSITVSMLASLRDAGNGSARDFMSVEKRDPQVSGETSRN